jgi:activator of 2-hydroxyglutaryl-CoA dehydratase
MASNTSKANIVRAVHDSIAHRISAQIGALLFEPEHVFTGGVAYNSDLLTRLETELKITIKRPQDPEITGALGAAILAAKD